MRPCPLTTQVERLDRSSDDTKSGRSANAPLADVLAGVYALLVIQKLRRAWHSARALQHFARGEPNAALRSIEAMRAISPLTAAERMWSYYPLVGTKRFDEAFEVLDEVCRETNGVDSENGNFVNLCARAARASSHGDLPLRDQLLRQASRLKPKSATRMWLQLDGSDGS